ncbi:cold-shock protein [Bradyrhizobium sp. 191]|uniref:cold-shock protein n=1 Tax=Bradyrhizobium sp. 191 TaxID=2782659 RepID=UPI001FFFAFE7|nr:cold-shock protein [Bradyrhizobium sp. 191]UPJ63647.1 cold-shock protein [Bradyrhizobium sp. 191]
MTTGIVKWFNATKGYGFIKLDDGGADVFVHIGRSRRPGYTDLAEGALIRFEIKSGSSGKVSAENLRTG